MKKWKLLKSEHIYSNKWLTISKNNYLIPEDKTVEAEILKRGFRFNSGFTVAKQFLD